MGNDAANVLVGAPLVTGAIFVGPAGTTLPTDSDTALDTDLVCVGYVSKDGYSEDHSQDSTEVEAWGGDVVATLPSKYKLELKYTLIETNEFSLMHYYGDDNVDVATVGGEITIQFNGALNADSVIVIEEKYKGRAMRTVLPHGGVTGRDSVKHVHDDVIGYPVTVGGAPDSSGNAGYRYIAAAA